MQNVFGQFSLSPGLLMVAFLLVMISGCAKDKEELVTADYRIDSELKPYFERFVQEAESRGMIIDLVAANIEGELTDITTNDVVGQCSYARSSGIRTVRVDINYWNRADDLEREFVVFHELGHCVLERGHLDSQNARGQCTSMMHSGLGGCRFMYNRMNRSAYLDELFQ